MASTNRLQVTQLDFDTIKENFKTFLRNQSEFSDYDFEGSNMNILLDILAYNTHYNAYYLNMVANEAFLDTAVLRDSVVSHAKVLGYTPYSKKASKAVVNIDCNASGVSGNELTLPRGFKFRSNVIDNRSYTFVLLDELVATRVNDHFYYENVPIYEGEIVSYQFTYSSSENPKSVFTLPDLDIDTTTLKVVVRESISNTSTEVFNLSTDIFDIGPTSPVYFLQETLGQKFQIYFGNGSIGKAIKDGSIIQVSYLSTNGSAPNKVNAFIINETVSGFSNFDVTTVLAAAGGAEKQSVDEIKYAATAQYSTQNRLVTIKDYEYYLKKSYPSIDSLSIWSGEDETPKIYGKIFISLKPKNNYYISEVEKQKILNEIIAPKSIIAIGAEIRDPDYLFILLDVKAKYNPSKTALTPQQIKSLIRQKILEYNTNNLNQFQSSLIVSRLQDEIDSADLSILGNELTLKLQKIFTPSINQRYSYTVNFNVPLKRGTSINKLTSTEFIVNDINNIRRTVIFEEIPNSDTGISRINVTNPGSGYTSPPIVTITGDGTGATAVAKIVNGRVESIELTNRGIDYTKAVIKITGGEGLDATATAVIDTKIGELRTVYFNDQSERIVVDNKAGTVDYELGIIKINDINILQVVEGTDIKFTIESEEGILTSIKNTILYIDETNPSSISINLVSA